MRSTSSSSHVTAALAALTAVSLLAACQQDPYRIRTLSDGIITPSDLDGQLPPDTRRPSDALSDGTADTKPANDISYDACAARPEVCNNVDDNCNNQIDEGFDKLNDARYCDSCKGCNWLMKMNAYPGCKNGSCVISSCMGGWVDANGKVDDGCEYPCTPTGVEVCDGVDNDCNGKVDDGLPAAPTICKTLGPCAGATATCMGKQGWQCNYDLSKGVELQPCTQDTDCGPGNTCDKTAGVCPGIVIANEKKCDGFDGDCDGVADDPWDAFANPTLPTALKKDCDLDTPPKKGVCRNVGRYACDTTKTKTVCAAVTCTKLADCPTGMTCVGTTCTAGTSSAETCNGLDDDCDGLTDNLLASNTTAEQWINIGTVSVFRYEASRPDANATLSGIASTGRPCSVPNRLPWASVTKEEAQAACVRAGARLCTTAEWEKACKGTANTAFPYGATFDATACNGKAYAATPAVLPTDKPGGKCVSTWTAGTIFNMSGNVKEWTATAFSGSTPTAYEIKGGAFDTPSINGFGAGLSCDYDLPAPSSNLQLPTLGFRCCK
jgi:hypothetical protein